MITLSTEQIDAIRQTQASLAIEQFTLKKEGLAAIERMVKGDISREEFQARLKEKYRVNEKDR